jgi:hypothetical protein
MRKAGAGWGNGDLAVQQDNAGGWGGGFVGVMVPAMGSDGGGELPGRICRTQKSEAEDGIEVKIPNAVDLREKYPTKHLPAAQVGLLANSQFAASGPRHDGYFGKSNCNMEILNPARSAANRSNQAVTTHRSI